MPFYSPGSVLIAAVGSVADGTPEKLIDRWTGKEYPAAPDKTAH